MCTATLYLRIKVTGYKIEHAKVKVRLRFIIFASEPCILALNFLLEHIDCQDISIADTVESVFCTKKKNGPKSASGTRSLSRSFPWIDLLLILTDLCSPPASLCVQCKEWAQGVVQVCQTSENVRHWLF